MIQKLRGKFIAWSLFSIFTLLFLILGGVNLSNYIKVGVYADTISQMIADHGEPYEQDNPDFGDRDDIGPYSPETRYEMRYFIVNIDANENASIVKKQAVIEDNDAFSYAKAIYETKMNDPMPTGWWMDFYRYRINQKSDGTCDLIFVNQARELVPTLTVLRGSFIGGFVGFFLSAIILIPVSKAFVKPYAEAQQKQKMFISNSSHELKTPLTIISANNELLELQYGENEYSDAISKQIQRLTTTIKTMNTLTRLEETKEKELTKQSLSSLCADAVEPYRRAFEAAKIDLRIKIDSEVHIKTSEIAIMTLISILMDNALKYASTYTEFRLIKEGMSAVMCLKNDTKQELKEEEIENVFERFSRGASARASSIEGSGIGLSMAQKIAEQHGADISAEIEDGDFLIKVNFKNSILI